MTKRNVMWLVVLVAVGVIVAISVSLVWGLLAAGAVLVSSELFERARRKRLRAARGITSRPSVTDAIRSRRGRK
jgi:nitrogen fixation protein FixH